MVARARWIVIGAVGAVTAVAAACSGFSGTPSASTSDAGTGSADGSASDASSQDAGAATDANTVDGADAATPMCDVAKPFGAPSLVTELNQSGDDFGLRLSSDSLTAYFASAKDASGPDLWIATRTSTQGAFSNLAPITAINGVTDFPSNPSITGDGLSLYFNATLVTNADIFVSTRGSTGAPFPSPAVVSNVNSVNPLNVAPYVSEDGEAIYFASGNSTFELYVAQRGTSGFSTPMAIDELHTNEGEATPVVTPDGLVLYYGSQRTDGGALGGNDVWVATRGSTASQFGTPRNVTEVNTIGNDFPSFITRDRCTLYLRHDEVDAGVFTSTREIWVATRTP